MTKIVWLTHDCASKLEEEIRSNDAEHFIVVLDGITNPSEYSFLSRSNCTVVKSTPESLQLFKGTHPRMSGLFPQYTGTSVGLAENVTLSFVVNDDIKLRDWQGEPLRAKAHYGPQSSEEYVASHNHTQGLLVEGWNFTSDVNTISIWGDALAARTQAKVWGGFLSARSNLLGDWAPYTPPSSSSTADKFDAQLIGLEIDVLNGGLDSGQRVNERSYPLAKNGLQIVGFGKRNSAAIEVRCEDSDDTSRTLSNRRGAWDYVLIARNCVHDKSTFICSGFSKGYKGIDLSPTLYSDGAIRLRTEHASSGIVFNSDSAQIYEARGELFVQSKSGIVNIGRADDPIKGVAKQILRGYQRAWAHRNISEFALFYDSLNVSYSYIPKNACTSLKLSLGVHDGTMDASASPHGLERAYITHSYAPHMRARRFIVFREPFGRIVSAYLDKITRPVEDFAWSVCADILRNQRGVRAEHVAEYIQSGETPSFAEFVRYLSVRSDEQLNEHWRSQCAFYTFDWYDGVFPLEALDDEWKKSKFSDVPLVTSRPHATTYGRKKALSNGELGTEEPASELRGGVLRRIMEEQHLVPAPELLLADQGLLRLFCRRYGDDIAVYHALFPNHANVALAGLGKVP